MEEVNEASYKYSCRYSARYSVSYKTIILTFQVLTSFSLGFECNSNSEKGNSADCSIYGCFCTVETWGLEETLQYREIEKRSENIPFGWNDIIKGSDFIL